MRSLRNRLANGASIALAAALTATCAEAALDFTITPSKTNPSPGETFYVTVSSSAIAAGDDVTSIWLVVAYNTPNAILNYLGPEYANPASPSTPGCAGSPVSFPGGQGSTQASSATSVSSSMFVPSGNQITGTGCILKLRFQMSPSASPGATTNMSLTGACYYTNSAGIHTTPTLPAAPVAIHAPFVVTGTVRTWKCGTTARPIPGVTLNLEQPDVAVPTYTSSDNSKENGTYSIEGQLGTNARITSSRLDVRADFATATPPALVSDPAFAINSTDWGLIFDYQFGVNQLMDCPISDAGHCGSPTTVYPQRIAADVDGTGVIDGNDASIILGVVNYVQGGSMTFPTNYPLTTTSPNWRFYCAVNHMTALSSTNASYDPTGVLIGDVNGSYLNNSDRAKKGTVQARLTVPDVRSTQPSISIPVRIEGARDIKALQARLLYNPAVLRYVSGHAAEEGTGIQVSAVGRDGTVVLVVAGSPSRINGSPTLAVLNFERVAPESAKAFSPLLLSNALIDDEAAPVRDGSFATSAPGAETASWGVVKGLYR